MLSGSYAELRNPPSMVPYAGIEPAASNVRSVVCIHYTYRAWLRVMDSNHDKELQRLPYYRYTNPEFLRSSVRTL